MALAAIPPDPGISYASVVQRQRRVLFCQSVESVSTPPIWRRGTAPLSAYFDLSPHNISPNVFKVAARKAIPFGHSFGLKTHQEGKKVLAEIYFSSEEARIYHCNQGVPLEGFTVYGFPALPSDDTVLRIKLTNLPFISEAQLKEGIFDLLAPYGVVLEGGIMIDHGWYDGTGYAVIRIPSGTTVPPVTHELSWNDVSVVYATWSAMPLHCSYCHKPNHSRVDCPIRADLRCWTCLATGHLRIHCPKRIPKAPTDSKKKSKKKNNKIVTDPVPPAPKRSPPSSDSESDKPSLSRPPPLKQPRPLASMEVVDTPSSSAPPPSSSRGNQSLEHTFKHVSPEAFAKALRGG